MEIVTNMEIGKVFGKLFVFENGQKVMKNWTTIKWRTTHRLLEKFALRILSKSGAQKYFTSLPTGYFDVKDQPRSGYSIIEKAGEILKNVHQDEHITIDDVRPQNCFESSQSW